MKEMSEIEKMQQQSRRPLSTSNQKPHMIDPQRVIAHLKTRIGQLEEEKAILQILLENQKGEMENGTESTDYDNHTRKN